MPDLLTIHALMLALLIVAVWCGVNYLFILILHWSGRLQFNEAEANERAFQFGLCGILALGFLGLIAK